MNTLGAPIAPEAKPFDIFRVYFENHPEFLEPRKPPVTKEKEIVDLTAKSELTALVRPEIVLQHNDVPELVEGAIVARSEKDIQLIADVNGLLLVGNYAGAEYLLGRRLTIDEIKAQSIHDARKTPISPDEQKRLDIAKMAQAVTLGLHAAKSNPAQAKKDMVTAIAQGVEQGIRNTGGHRPDSEEEYEDDQVDDEILEIGDRLRSYAPTEVGTQRYASSERGYTPSEVATRVDWPQRYALTDVDPMEERKLEDVDDMVPRPRDDGPNISIWGTEDFDLTQVKAGNKGYTVPMLKVIADDMVKAHPSLEPLFKHLKGKKGFKSTTAKLDLVKAVMSAQKTIDKDKAKDAAQHHLPIDDEEEEEGEEEAIDQEAIDQLHDLLVPLPLKHGKGLGAIGHFNKNAKALPSDPLSFVPFGPRYLVNMKKLKHDGTMVMVYRTGLRNAVLKKQQLTPALKECFLNYLSGEPMDTLSLNKDESEYLKYVWANVGLAKKQAPVKFHMRAKKQGKAETKDRVKVIMGLIQAGNDSPKLLEELEEGITKISANNWLSKSDVEKLREFI